ncbi:MAG: peptide chain release factor N(5)-glutamine methyltransferase [Gemmatimonadota bacterium]|nr:peptide chain release factor N(5)-glutamine methyltransferase [Gemmatimonadota bacterium]
MADVAIAPLTVGDTVARMAEILSSNDEARELLALLHDMPRFWPSTSAEQLLTSAEAEMALDAARRRATGMPIQYAAGRAAFRHMTLDVDARVLIPRPETEQLVDLVLEHARGERGGTAVDVGTGSGAIALSLASEGRFARVIGTDVSLDALTVARANATKFANRCCASVDLRQGSLLGPVPEQQLAAIVSNPPYIAFGEAADLPASVRDWEPSVALFSGDDGMALSAQLIRDAASRLAPLGMLALEADSRRAMRVAGLAASHGAYVDVRVLLDLTGRERFVVARRREE